MTLSGLSIPWIKLRHAICLALTALAVAPVDASALTAHEVVGLNSPANGVVVGPDGNIWAAEEAAGTGGRVWVAVTGADKLVWFDATAPSPPVHDIPLGAGCGPVGIAAGGDGRMY